MPGVVGAICAGVVSFVIVLTVSFLAASMSFYSCSVYDGTRRIPTNCQDLIKLVDLILIPTYVAPTALSFLTYACQYAFQLSKIGGLQILQSTHRRG